MESSKFQTNTQALNEAFAEQKSHVTTSSDEFLSDEELEAVSGGGLPFDGDFVRACTEAVGAVAKAGESVGRTIGRTFWNGDRH